MIPSVPHHISGAVGEKLAMSRKMHMHPPIVYSPCIRWGGLKVVGRMVVKIVQNAQCSTLANVAKCVCSPVCREGADVPTQCCAVGQRARRTGVL